MSRLIVCALVALAFTGAAFAHNTPYGFTKRDVLRHQTRLQYALNSLPVFRDLDAKVVCEGENPVKLRGGATGYRHIRCFTGLNTADWLYHLNRRGYEFVTRPYVP